MQTLDEKAKVNQYPYNSKFGMWAVEITEHISRNWFKKGYELCQKEYEEKLRWIHVSEKMPPQFAYIELKDSEDRIFSGMLNMHNEFRDRLSNNRLHFIVSWRSFL